MKVLVRVKDKQYTIPVGSGHQDIAWLALSACHLYSKEAYPKGNYLPTLLFYTESERVPHPRRRVEVLTEKDVTVNLMNPGTIPEEREALWYDQAFGSLRNLMDCTFEYRPIRDWTQGVYSNTEVQLKFKYSMFEELRSQYNPEDHEGEKEMFMYEEDPSKKLFTVSCSLPFGEITGLEIREVNITKDGEQSEPNVLEKKEQDGLTYLLLPEPWSKKKMKEQLILEEQKQREREEEVARNAQAKVQQVEAQPIMPIKTIYDVWGEAPQALAQHFPLLYDIFAIYANFHQPDEDMISAHDFFHILRSFDLVTEIEELVQVIIELGEYLEDPLEDVLSQSLSLQDYLVLLVKFSEWRNPDDGGYQSLIDSLAKSKAMWLQDDVKAEIVRPEISELFMENEDLLIEKYLSKSTPAQGIRTEMKIKDFVELIVSNDQFREVITEDKLLQLCGDTLYFSSAKDSQMLYPDFLETLLRLAQTVPFSEEEIKQAMEDQEETIILAEKLHTIIKLLCGGATRTPSTGSIRATESRGAQRQALNRNS